MSTPQSKISGVYEISSPLGNYYGSSGNVNKRKIYHYSCLRRHNHPCKELQNAWNIFGADRVTFRIVAEAEIGDARILEHRLSEMAPSSLNTFNNSAKTFNQKYHKRLLTADQVREVIQLRQRFECEISDLAAVYGVQYHVIYYIVTGKDGYKKFHQEKENHNA